MSKIQRRLQRLREIAALAPRPPGTDPIATNLSIITEDDPTTPSPPKSLDLQPDPKLPQLDRHELWDPIRQRGDVIPLTSALDERISKGELSIGELQDCTLVLAESHADDSVQEYLRIWFAFQRITALIGSMRRQIQLAAQEYAAKTQSLDQRFRGLWHDLPNTAARKLADSTPVVRFRPKLDENDRQLVARWHQESKQDQTRLEAARRAERAALAYYRSLGQVVEDVSIEQLDRAGDAASGPTPDWTLLDLRSDGRPLDVKNARCRREDRFPEHYWKRQKRVGSREIPIVGVVTTDDTHCSIVAGELLLEDLTSFRKQVAACRRGPRVSPGPRGWPTFIPGWLLEFPTDHYESMPDLASVARRWLALADQMGTGVPPWIRGIAASRLPELRHHALETGILTTIQQHFRIFQPSRRTVFWFVLYFMLSQLRNPDAAGDVTEHLFAGGAKDLPLGLHDPGKYVWSLIHALNQVVAANRDVLENASHIDLVGFGILRARVGDRWRTILAYCGVCAKWPIFLGTTHHSDQLAVPASGSCQSCPCGNGRLVCDECGSCSGERCRQGIRYADSREARRAAMDFPGWIQAGDRLYPPRPW